MSGAPPPAGAVQQGDRLALIFQELLTAVVRVRAGRQHVPDAGVFRAQVLEAVRLAEEQAQRKGYSAQQARYAVFAIVAFLDETVLNSPDPVFRDWARRPLGQEMFQRHEAGETFFQHVRTLLMGDDSQATADVLEIYQLCLLLGYRGRYGFGREGELRAIEDRIGEKLQRIRLVLFLIYRAFLSAGIAGLAASVAGRAA
jgi:type VI secretion system protein ImpK